MTERLLGTSPDQITEFEKEERLLAVHEEKRAYMHSYNHDTDDASEFLDRVNKWDQEVDELHQLYPDLPPDTPIKVVELQQDCGGCPTSWSGMTENGKHIEARYRWGYLSVTVGNDDFFGKQIHRDTPEEKALEKKKWEEEHTPEEIKEKQLVFHGDHIISYSGVLNYQQLIENTKGWIEWPNFNKEEPWGTFCGS